ncbi:OmpA family protein [Flammeovirga aprica]|uniref:OmpA family protein n=1 Tax=Flammeovirga aprica JL-4 TaxID=694437 RepID=A0A7X9XCU1_9BACT|nr:OmpA family protein [Flammeovirga aprica]NME72191.1 OmpA family protein [Flammeovirga aprica JL-4]
MKSIFTIIQILTIRILFYLSLAFLLLPNDSLAQKNKKSPELKKHLKFAEESIEFDLYQQAIDVLLEVEKEGQNFDDWNFLMGYAYQHSLYLNKSKSLYYFEKVKDRYLYCKIKFYIARALHLNHRFEDAYKLFDKFLGESEGLDKETIELVNRYKSQCVVGRKLMKDSLDLLIVNLGEKVNTKYTEIVPLLSADESMMVITSRREGSKGGEVDELSGLFYEDVYITHRDNEGEWQQLKSISDNINTVHHDAAVGLSPDGNTLFLYHADGKNGESGGDLYKSEWNGIGWTNLEPLPGEINSSYSETHASMTADGKSIYFTSTRKNKGAIGKQDIYVAHLQTDGSWGNVQNLGPNINSEEDEEGPFVHPNGKVLYFSSKGHEGMGGYDIFYSEWNEMTQSWDKAKNIGYPINTADHDVFYVISADGERGYFSSIRNDSYGGPDIYMAMIPSKTINLIAVNGEVRDAETRNLIEAHIEVVDNYTGEVVQNFKAEGGKYLFYLDPNRNYGFRVMQDGYLFHSENIFIPEQTDYIEISEIIALQRIGDQKREPLSNVFLKDRDLKSNSKYELSELTNFIKKLNDYVVDINVHAAKYEGQDSVELLKLTQIDADRIFKELISNGVDMEKVSVHGYGWQHPIASNQSQLGRIKNERIEYVVRTPEETVVFEEIIETVEEPLPQITPYLGEVMNITGTITFAFGSNQITAECYKIITQVFDVMYRYPNLVVEVGGHTDNKGSSAFNYQLGEKRARIVVQELVRLGIERDRLKYKSFGFDMPIADNNTDEGRKKNRRISFTPLIFK